MSEVEKLNKAIKELKWHNAELISENNIIKRILEGRLENLTKEEKDNIIKLLQ